MESLKSKILDLEQYEQKKRGSLKESRENYAVTDSVDSSSEPIWPFVESDYT